MAKKPVEQALPDRFPTLTAGEEVVRAELERIRARQADATIGFDRDLAMAAAALLRSAVSAEGERRQQAKQDARTVAEFPIEMLVAHLQTLDIEDRQHLCREVLGEDDDRSVL